MKSITRKISKYNFSSRSGQKIKYIVMHFTGNNTDTALNNANYFGGGNRDASAHYFVDNDNIVQVVEDNNASWHCGDGNGKYGITNQNSIGIEMCGTNSEITTATELNAIDLVKHLMTKYNIPIDRVVRHYDASRKICPSPWSNSNCSKWNNFKKKLTDNKPIANDKLYRIRKAWKDASSQIGAYKDLSGAKVECDKHKGYSVYDNSGICVYPKPQVKEEEEMVKCIIQYENEVDMGAANILADALRCCTINSKRPYGEYNKFEIVIAVGGGSKFSGYTKYKISPADRYSTTKVCAELGARVSNGEDILKVLEAYKIK